MSKVYLAAIAVLSLYAASLRADSCGPHPVPQVPDVCGLTLFGVGGRFDVPAGKPYAYAEVFGSQRVQLWRGDRKIAETTSNGDGKFAFPPVPEGEYTFKVAYDEGIGIQRRIVVAGKVSARCQKPLFAYLGDEGWPCRANLDTVRPLKLAPDSIHKKR